MGRPSGARQSAQIKKVSLLHICFTSYILIVINYGAGGGGGLTPSLLNSHRNTN